MELKSVFYQEVIEGIQVFEKIERMFEGLEFSLAQDNLLAATRSHQSLS